MDDDTLIKKYRKEEEAEIRADERAKCQKEEAQKKYHACQTCGFPLEVEREPLFLDDNLLSIILSQMHTCKECGHQDNGLTIPIVSKNINEVYAETVQRVELKAKQRFVKVTTEELKKLMPRLATWELEGMISTLKSELQKPDSHSSEGDITMV